MSIHVFWIVSGELDKHCSYCERLMGSWWWGPRWHCDGGHRSSPVALSSEEVTLSAAFHTFPLGRKVEIQIKTLLNSNMTEFWLLLCFLKNVEVSGHFRNDRLGVLVPLLCRDRVLRAKACACPRAVAGADVPTGQGDGVSAHPFCAGFWVSVFVQVL